LEKSDMNVKAYESFNKIFNKRFIDFSDAMLKIRSVKTREEIQRIRIASELTVKGMRAVNEAIRSGITERELARTFEYEVRKRADWFSFETIVSAGKNSAEPHHMITDYKVKKNDFILVDCGVLYKNMHSDMTRTFCLSPSKEQRKIYDIVLSAQQTAMKNIKLNMKASSLDSVARNIVDKAGYGNEFTHSLGHGVGVEIHESPSISTGSKDILKENMIFTVEPGIYVKGFGGARIEDTVLLNKKGIEILTKYPRKL
jgi:Xaa-Pro aminopeptidase